MIEGENCGRSAERIDTVESEWLLSGSRRTFTGPAVPIKRSKKTSTFQWLNEKRT